jgi:benzoyl-CoA reductase subunit C
MDINDILDKFKTISEDINYNYVYKWKEKNQKAKIIGVFPIFIPAEIIYSFGALPVNIAGACGKVDIDKADSVFTSFVCSITRSTLELLYKKKLDILDGAIFSNICDPARNLSGVIQRNFQNKAITYLHLPQRLDSKSSQIYLIDEFTRLKNNLEDLTHIKSNIQNLNEAILIYNNVRTSLNNLLKTRQDAPHLLSFTEYSFIAKASTLMDPNEFISMVEELRAGLSRRKIKPKDRIRILIEGAICEQPPYELFSTIEEAGCYIVEDDWIRGIKWLDNLKVDKDPICAMSESYCTTNNHSAMCHVDEKKRISALLNRIKTSKCDGVIMLLPKFCEPLHYEAVLIEDALKKNNIRYIEMEYEEKQTIFETNRNEIETFIESIMFF